MLYGENRTRSDCTGIACRRSSSADWQAKKRPIAARSMRRRGNAGRPALLVSERRERDRNIFGASRSPRFANDLANTRAVRRGRLVFKASIPELRAPGWVAIYTIEPC